MSQMNALLVDEQEFWLSELPNYQRSTVKAMLDDGMDYESAASAWMSGTVATGTAPFSATLGPKVFFDKFLDQLHDFLCTGLNYEEERAAVMSGFKPKQTGLAATITAAIAPHLGAAPVFLAPAIALILCAIGKMSLGAWCQMQTERRASQGTGTSTEQEPTEP
ncbi:hypothetical protein [Streptomyces sp. NPDC050546]|uniref:hypothetical protein n=1 Tax=Streptomyces sp. NPDC050546 TaxID=3365628 RepID=UPI00378D8AAF